MLINNGFSRRKTELSLWMIEKLGAPQFVFRFRANDWEAFTEDLMTSALLLKSGLLRLNTVTAGSREPRESQTNPRLYFSDAGATPLTKLLEAWMKSTRDESSRLLVILDDLDGLNVAHHRTVSLMFAADTLDLIYTARDPLMADREMIWEAKNFEVPALQGDHAADLLQDFMMDRRITRRNKKVFDSLDVSDIDRGVTAVVVNRLGALPAAITIASHYVNDHFFTSLERLLDDWDNGHILRFRRDTSKYTHTMLESFELSKVRLQRNTNGKSPENLYRLSLAVLELFSVLHLKSFKPEDLDLFCKILGDYPRNGSQAPLDLDLQFLSGNCRVMKRCVTELIRVSLFSGPDADGSIKLNNLIISCALLIPDSIGHDEQSMLQKYSGYFESHANGGHDR